jgi:outer membrane immunogenic protein
MKRTFAGLATLLAVLSTPVFADGLPTRAAPAACCDARPWTGFYVGAGVGAGAVVHELSVTGFSFDGIGGEGIFGTVTVGYDRLIHPRIVAGVFADYDFSDISTDLAVSGLFSASVNHKSAWSVGARLGYLTSPTTLWYGTAGYTEAKFNISTSGGSLDLPDGKGYFIGGGAESQLRGNWALRAEYRFTQFEAESILGPLEAESSMHTGRVVLTYKFAREDHAAPLK